MNFLSALVQYADRTIIGVAGHPKAPLEKTSDTVVPHLSLHPDAARSENIVPYPLTAMFVKPEATDEIKCILRLHPASLGDAQTRAEVRGYARLPLLRQELSALADGERSEAILRQVFGGKWICRRVATVDRKASRRIR